MWRINLHPPKDSGQGLERNLTRLDKLRETFIDRQDIVNKTDLLETRLDLKLSTVLKLSRASWRHVWCPHHGRQQLAKDLTGNKICVCGL